MPKCNYLSEDLTILKDYLKDIFRNNKDLIIVNIGTDRSIYDSIAPLVGTLLNESNTKLTVLGCLDKPIHALNIEQRLQYINDKYKDYTILAIDACIGDDVGHISIDKKPIKAGAGAGKNLPSVGDYSIKCITVSEMDTLFSSSGNARLSFVYQFAQTIVKLLNESYQEVCNE